jgi:hypothetical protein
VVTGWWQSDRLFCLAVGLVGRWMVVFGAAVALLTFGSVFIAGARLAWPVYFVPLLPLTSLLLALNPAARRWSDG